jgi:adenine C2-methylase RlmN of 23S rRNA A2503 and tRNA A37
MNAERQTGLSSSDKKRLLILEKLKEEWDIYPNKSRYTISSAKYHRWMYEIGIDDFNQFENILLSLRDKGLVSSFEFMPEYM